MEISRVSLVANKVTLKGTVNRVFPETMLFLSIIQTECFSFLDYTGVTKAGNGLMNVVQQDHSR